MATIVIEQHGSDRGSSSSKAGQGGAPVTTSVNSASLTGFTVGDRTLFVTAAVGATLKLPVGWYERVGTDSSGNATYAPYRR